MKPIFDPQIVVNARAILEAAKPWPLLERISTNPRTTQAYFRHGPCVPSRERGDAIVAMLSLAFSGSSELLDELEKMAAREETVVAGLEDILTSLHDAPTDADAWAQARAGVANLLEFLRGDQ